MREYIASDGSAWVLHEVCPPVPTTKLDWEWISRDYDGPGDDRHGNVASEETAIAAIEEYIADGEVCSGGVQPESELEKVAREMAEHTEPECANTCRAPRSCCSREYCEVARGYAKAVGVELVETGHPTLPFMGSTGCTVAPHHRPLCTVHTCEIGAFGKKRGDVEWTRRYFDLRERFNQLLSEQATRLKGA